VQQHEQMRDAQKRDPKYGPIYNFGLDIDARRLRYFSRRLFEIVLGFGAGKVGCSFFTHSDKWLASSEILGNKLPSATRFLWQVASEGVFER
jgi:hypothetical protein